MFENPLKRRLGEGRPVLNGWLTIPSAFCAELLAPCGWDSLTVDLQHGVQDYMSMVACFQAMRGHPAVPLVRVPWNEPGIIGKVLDGGAYGVICPMVNTRAEAEALVGACRYPPDGFRSNGPIRAGSYGGGAYQKSANGEILVVPMIETRTAVDNLADILDVEGIDAIYVGPTDLGFSLGLEPRLDREEKEILDIYAYLLAETGRRGIAAGIHCDSAAYAARMIGMGFRLVTAATDCNLLSAASRGVVAEVRTRIGETGPV